MESSDGKTEIVRPIILKAGIPLTIALGGFLLAKVVTRKCHVPSVTKLSSEVSVQETGCSRRDGENETDRSCELQQEISLLRKRIEDIQDRECRLETRFLCYQHLKDQEMSLMELENKLLRDLNRVELFKRETSLLGTELHMFENMVTEYLKVSRLLQVRKSGNRMFRKKVEKLSRIGRYKARVLRNRNLKIEAKETEILRYKEVVDMKDDCIRKMEDEIKETKLTTEQLKTENNKSLHDSDIAEKSTPEGEKETISKKNYEATENYYELMYLRRCNAFLRHELMRKNKEQEEQIHDDHNHLDELMRKNKNQEEDQTDDDHNHLDTECEQMTGIEEFEPDNEVDRFASDGQTEVHVRGRRRKLIEKLKKWVDGVEKTNTNSTDTETRENKCFRRRSVSAGKEQSLPARNSCSSV